MSNIFVASLSRRLACRSDRIVVYAFVFVKCVHALPAVALVACFVERHIVRLIVAKKR